MLRRNAHPAEIDKMSDRRKVSFLKLVIVVVTIAGLAFAGSRWAWAMIVASNTPASSTWFAPYVDTTLPPTLHFEDPAQRSRDVVLGFIVADPTQSCTPSWGTYFSLDGAARALDLDRRIVRLRERGGDAVVSFGGVVNNELATVCTDVDRLTAGYAEVIDRYGLQVIDFDIEGGALADRGANLRRAQAISRLQGRYPGLRVWLTLPVAPHGMTVESIELIDVMLTHGVDLAGVNVMTMNYGESRAGMSMQDSTVAALMATWQQLDGAYRRAGTPLTESELWRRIGATPMIGLNDVAGDVFTIQDAHALAGFARKVDLGRLSFWSANRDVECGAAVDDERVSNTCSGVKQEPLEFTEVLAGSGPRSLDDTQEPPGTPTGGSGAAVARDDPLTSPYPLWRPAKAYVAGDKVTWQARVYQAKWWTQADQPDAPVKQVWETPWRYLGPVLESDREAIRAAKKVVDGIRPKWSAEMVYVAGDEVEYQKQLFRAKWWTQGSMPQEGPDQPYDHPWDYVGDVQTGEGR